MYASSPRPLTTVKSHCRFDLPKLFFPFLMWRFTTSCISTISSAILKTCYYYYFPLISARRHNRLKWRDLHHCQPSVGYTSGLWSMLVSVTEGLLLWCLLLYILGHVCDCLPKTFWSVRILNRTGDYVAISGICCKCSRSSGLD